MNTVLVVDDETTIAGFIKEALTAEGYTASVAYNGKEALKKAATLFPDIVILDYIMPDMNGIAVLKELKALDESVQVIMLTGFNSVPTAIEAMKLGAADYILKPFSIDALKMALDKVVEKISLRTQISFLRQTPSRRYGNAEFILCPSPKMTKVYELASQISLSADTTVLILGESGVGKEHIAKFIHYESVRQEKPFVEINCAAIPEHLLEAELFGYEPGAFTDARSKKIGLFEFADGGTLFLDEIGDMPLATQAKVLKLIEDKTFRRVGGLQDRKADVRIIAATNKDLAAEIARNKFREDLYYRLQVVPVVLPPLRERPEDILQLADFFLSRFSTGMRKTLEFSDAAVRSLLDYNWKGNVRELKNVIERAAILTPNHTSICPEHLAIRATYKPLDTAKPLPDGTHDLLREEAREELDSRCIRKVDLDALTETFSLKDHLDAVERTYITAALEQANGNQIRAAKLLGIERHVLRYQMKKFGIMPSVETD
jgi:two-component system, NtrC family, response regulator AtoC